MQNLVVSSGQQEQGPLGSFSVALSFGRSRSLKNESCLLPVILMATIDEYASSDANSMYYLCGLVM